jgi:hypothetical protein
MSGGVNSQTTVTRLDRWRRRRGVTARGGAQYTIRDVGAACGLPGPVIAQLVQRTWVDGVGWMYTGEQLRESVSLAENMRKFLEWSKAGVSVRCGHCRATPPDDPIAAARWLLVAEPRPTACCPRCRPQASTPN